MVKVGDLFKLFALAALMFYGYVLFLSNLGAVQSLQLKVVDDLYRARYRRLNERRERPDIPLVIVSIDSESLRMLGQRWPWKRRIFADFLDRVSKAGAGPVAFDLSFSVPSEDPQDDIDFGKGIGRNGNVILGSYFEGEEHWVGPTGQLEKAAHAIGFLNTPRDPDNTNRKHWPIRTLADREVRFSLSLLLCARHLGLEAGDLYQRHYLEAPYGAAAGGFSKGRTQSPAFWSAYDYRLDDFTVIPFWKVLRSDEFHSDLEGRMILVGATGEIFHDIYNTPLGTMPGVVVHANQSAAYLNAVRLITVSGARFYTALLAGLFFLTFVFYRLRTSVGLLLAGALSVIAYGVAVHLFERAILVDLFSILSVIAMGVLIGVLYRSVILFIENRGLKYQTTRDGLTDLYTYRFMERKLMSEFDRAGKVGEVVSLVIFDLDHFKHFNDAYGHEKGNEILIAFSRILKLNTRGDDLVARYGGEEFCVLLPRQNSDEAIRVAERVRESLAKTEFKFSRKGESFPSEIRVTVSAGICSSDSPDVFNGKELLRLADSALLRAKEQGRNRVCTHT